MRVNGNAITDRRSAQELAAYCAVGLAQPSLAAGIPADIIEKQAEQLFATRARMGWQQFRYRMIDTTATYAIMSGAFTAIATDSVGWTVGAALVGAALAIAKVRNSDRGTVSTKTDKGVENSVFYGSPMLRERSAEDIAAFLKANGLVYESIPPPSADAVPALAGKVSEAVAQRVTDLAEARRLVADLGVQSERGEPCLSVVSPLQALALVSHELPLFVISCNAAEQRQHSVDVSARNAKGSTHARETSAWTELAFAYTRTPFDGSSDAAAGIGVPPTIHGVYRDASRYSELSRASYGESGVTTSEKARLDLAFWLSDVTQSRHTLKNTLDVTAA